MSRKVFVIAGEPSGDALGASLMKESRGLDFVGIGGPLMEAQGLKSLKPMDDLCVMGVFEVIAQLPRLLKLIGEVVEDIEKAAPDIVLTIDLPDFNFEVVKRLRKRGKVKPKFVHYVAPSVWAWRPGRAKKVAGLYDGLLCLLPMDPPYFTAHGMDAQFVGHPMVERAMNYNREALRARHGIGKDERVLGLFLGSRGSEFKNVAPVIIEAAKQIKDVKFLVPTLPQCESRVRDILKAGGIEAVVISEQSLKWDTFAACDAAIAVSGTVGLELAYLGVPHIITYKFNEATALVFKIMLKTKYAHLANNIMAAGIVPEFLQENCRSDLLASAALTLLSDENKRAAQKAQLQNVANMLGFGDSKTPSQKAAEFLSKF